MVPGVSDPTPGHVIQRRIGEKFERRRIGIILLDEHEEPGEKSLQPPGRARNRDEASPDGLYFLSGRGGRSRVGS